MIHAFRIQDLPNNTLAQFCTEIDTLMRTHLDAEDQAMSFPFAACLAAFKTELRNPTESFADLIREADHAADQAWHYMNAQVAALSGHPNESIRHAAITVNEIFAKYGNPTENAYQSEYTTLANLLSELDAIDTDMLKTILLDEWVDELRCRVNIFNRVFQDKKQAEALVEVGATKRTRLALINSYSTLIDQLNAHLLLHAHASLLSLEREINATIDAHAMHHPG